MVRLMLLACALSVIDVRAQDVTHLYDSRTLETVQRTYTPNLTGMWNEDFLSQLTAQERSRAGSVILRLPLTGANLHPLDFYADSATRQVFLPISSIKFIDDIALAFSYYEARGCGQGPVSDYVGALRFQRPPTRTSPLAALGVPASATSDPTVDDSAQKILKSALYFVAAHEYAHVMYAHQGYRTITAADAQRQEEQADAFALEIMRRIGVAPLGTVYFFMVASRLEASPGDFATVDAYDLYLRQRSSHPVSARRILAIADGIDRSVSSFIRLEPNRAAAETHLRMLIPLLRNIASTLDDRKMRLFLEQRARSVDLLAFQRACRFATP